MVPRVARVILLDTHVLVWLYGGERDRIPTTVQQRLTLEQLGVSPFVQLELAYLYEVGRVRRSAQTVIHELGPRLELVVADVAAGAVCSEAIGLTWTRDPFDRLLAAHATVMNLPLVTRDETMLRHVPLAWWGR
ncbi:MAG: PIN domain-containing protein [Chloroflexi bacterium]|nr:PIN domain-containing protein [Chloroflexota bacterium]